MTVSRLFSLPLLALAPLMLAACGGEASSDGAAAAGEPLPAIAAPAGTKWADTVTVTPEGGYMIGNPDAPLKLVEYERQIIWCKRRTEAAREVIAREEEIGRISGFVNKKIMREAGESIVSCASNNPKLFAEYKQLGGRRTYQELK